ncbi:MAG: PGF-pre-PGF domain-containing protein [Methanomicrobiaceae archaeon]|nr:PGF-pre-PGF domain-containing protein [Methanomicrobiaceae archaeon]
MSQQILSFRSDNETGLLTAYNPVLDIILSTNGSGKYFIRGKDCSFYLALTGFGRTGNLINPDPGDIEILDNILISVHNDFSEWYINRDEGIEHGVTIMSSPEGKGNLVILHEISGNIIPLLEGRRINLSGDQGGFFTYSGLTAWDSTGKSLNVTLDLSGNTILWIVEDGNAVYPVTIDPLVEQYKILNATEKSADSNFGSSVSISGDYAIIGAPYADPNGLSNAGEAYIFYSNQGGDNNWGEVAVLRASDRSVDSFFGCSVSISGDYAVSGAYHADPGGLSSAGQAYVFYRNQGGENNWGEIATLNASDKSPVSQFGYSVSISGDEIIAGARYADPDGLSCAGQAYIFSRNHGGENNWGEVAILNASDKSANSLFGYSVSISGDNAIIGTPAADPGGLSSAGQAYTFSRNHGGENNWGEVAILNASDKSADSSFGNSVSIFGDNAIIGAYCADPAGLVNAGQAYIFSRNHGGENNWGEITILNASDKSSNSYFGNSVSIYENNAISGAHCFDSGGIADSGQAYVFYKNQGGDGNWGEIGILNASDAAAGALFGSSISLSGDYLLAGAFDADIEAMGDAGQGYIFAYMDPVFSSVTPSSGCNYNSSLPVTITGDNFFGTPVVRLKKTGEPDITATGGILSGTTQLDCTFDLSGSSPGGWDVEVVNPDGRSATKPGVFTITAPPVMDIPTSTDKVSSGNSGAIKGQNQDTGVGASMNIEAGETVSYLISKGAVYKVSVTAESDIKKLMITVRSCSDLPQEINYPLADVYEFEEVKIYYAEDSEISGGKFYFFVSKNQLSSLGYSKEDISMIHYNGETWDTLPTLYTGEDGSCYYYSSETMKFSYFAIVMSENASILPENEVIPSVTITPVLTDISESTAITAQEIKVSEIQEETGSEEFSVPGVAFITLILTGVIGAGIWGRRRRARYPDWWFEKRK